ncbi:MAG: RNA pseudouridine synthase [Acidobacteria bacterium]|nr:RNA pseudouridine synthase [Acidobacteriota bacterium]
MPATGWGWEITPEELESWKLQETEDLLVLNKPPLVVCHPSKHGPWSSLIGACREYLGLERLHLPFRLDRETSGILLVIKNHRYASRLQGAVLKKRFHKTYWAILHGTLAGPVTVTEPIGREDGSPFFGRQCVLTEGGQASETEIIPIGTGGGYTLARIHPRSGRLHQIRVHAAWLGHPIAGDKLYPDPQLMLEFMRDGFSPHLASLLPMNRQALHAAEVSFDLHRDRLVYQAPLTADLAHFCRQTMNLDPGVLSLDR